MSFKKKRKQPTKLCETIKEILWFCCSSWHPITVTFFILIRSQANISKWLIFFLFYSYFVCMCACVSSLGSFNEFLMFLFLTINKQKYNITNNKTVPIEWWQREMFFFSFSYNFNIRHLVAGELFFLFFARCTVHIYVDALHILNNYTQENKKYHRVTIFIINCINWNVHNQISVNL